MDCRRNRARNRLCGWWFPEGVASGGMESFGSVLAPVDDRIMEMQSIRVWMGGVWRRKRKRFYVVQCGCVYLLF